MSSWSPNITRNFDLCTSPVGRVVKCEVTVGWISSWHSDAQIVDRRERQNFFECSQIEDNTRDRVFEQWHTADVDCICTKWRSCGSPNGQQHIYRRAVVRNRNRISMNCSETLESSVEMKEAVGEEKNISLRIGSSDILILLSDLMMSLEAV